MTVTNIPDQTTTNKQYKVVNNRLNSIRNANFSNYDKNRTPRMKDYLRKLRNW